MQSLLANTGTAAQQSGGLLSLLLPMVIFFGAMYVMVILPQRKKEKKTKEMLNAVKVGDNVITISGIIGKVINIKDDEITLETSVEKTQLCVKRWGIKEIQKPMEA